MRTLVLIFALCLTYHLHSQDFLSWRFNDRYFSLSVGSGVATYFGELNSNNSINDRLSLISLGIEARLLSKVGARLDAAYYTLQGSDATAPDSSFQRQRNLSFNSRNFQTQLHIVYYFRRYNGDYFKRWSIDPYLFSGIGYTFFNPTAELAGERFNLREAQTEGVSYARWAWNLPVGLGLKFKINEFTNLNFEASYHFAFTDYLDDVSNTYATEFANSTSEILSDRKSEIGIINQEAYDQIVPGARRGNPENNDGYLLLNVKLEFFLPPVLFSQ